LLKMALNTINQSTFLKYLSLLNWWFFDYM
jgi:hypothetical protein